MYVEAYGKSASLLYSTPYVRMYMRLEVDLEAGEELHERAKDYAAAKGLRLSRAYRDLIDEGLESEGF